jgi:Transposase DDE domain/Transposase domain (DUF772)
MYKKTNPQQKLFGVGAEVSAKLRSRIEGSWAQLFKRDVLPILFRNEDRYAMLYGKTGRPNFSVARVLGLCVLQEYNNLTDQEALDELSFDLRWRYALDVTDEEDYFSRRSLVEFRRRLAAKDPEMRLVREVFDRVRDAAIKALSISTSNQRLDSTHVISNIRVRGRVTLFSNTVRVFLKSLSESQFARIPKEIQAWYATEPDGWFGLAPAEQKMKLKELAQYLYELLCLFKNDADLRELEPYQLLQRLFSEHCELTDDEPSDAQEPKIQLKKEIEGEMLQSPYDPDASYGHKGAGYSVHIAETCNNSGETEIITDYEVHGAARSDVGKALPAIGRLDASGLKPEILFADGGYPSVPSALRIVEQNIEFMTPVNRSRLPEEVIGRDRFEFNPEGFATCCPMGQRPIDHRILSRNNGTDRCLHAIFDGDLCRSCTMLDRCPVRAPNHRLRGCRAQDTVGDFRLEITPEMRLRDTMYSVQQTEEWKERYRIRSGIEATNSELKRSHGFGRLRVRRAAKVCFAIAFKLIACNVKRWARAQVASKALLQALLSIFRSFDSLCDKILLFSQVLSAETPYGQVNSFTAVK